MASNVPLGKLLSQWIVDSGAMNELYSIYLRNVQALLRQKGNPKASRVFPYSKSNAIAFGVCIRFLESHALTNTISCLHSEVTAIPAAAQGRDAVLRKKLQIPNDSGILSELLRWRKLEGRPRIVLDQFSDASDSSGGSSAGEHGDEMPPMMSPRRPRNVDINVTSSSDSDAEPSTHEPHSDEDIGEMDEETRRVVAEVDVGDVEMDTADALTVKLARIEKTKDLSRPLQGLLARTLPFSPVGRKIVSVMDK